MPGDTGRWRVAEGEEARLTPGAAADAELWSRGFLPLRARSEGSYRLRPAFPGTAVVLGALTYEAAVRDRAARGRALRLSPAPWPEGEVVRDRVVYGPAFVRAAQAERERARGRERARPFRFLLYPIVGLLPEEEQVRLSDRFGLYAVTATLVSGLLEGLLILLVPLLLSRRGAAYAIGAVTTSAAFALLALPAFGRAFSAFFLRETGGSAPVVFLYEALRALGVRLARHDRSLVPLTRAAFWERLARPDTVTSRSRRLARVPGSPAAPHVGRHAEPRSRRRLLAGDTRAGRARPRPPRPRLPPRARGRPARPRRAAACPRSSRPRTRTKC